MTTDKNQITLLLGQLSDGKREAVDQLMPLVYEQLQAMAKRQLRGERPDHTLNSTALVHEAYLKLVDQTRVTWQNRAPCGPIRCCWRASTTTNWYERRAPKN